MAALTGRSTHDYSGSRSDRGDRPKILQQRPHPSMECSYVIALETEERMKGMYIGDGKEPLSFRQSDKYLLLGGQAHRIGENRAGGQYEELKKAAEEMYPQSRVTACWSAQDSMTADEIPFIGRYSKECPDWYVATGFQKWGMSFAMVSAMLLKDMGCELNWNPEELTRDCPCHGSRFDREGNLIDGPAQEGICHE